MDIEGSPTITDADIADLDRRAVLRTTTLLRRGAAVAVAVAGLLLLAWLWNLVRTQQLLSDSFGDPFGVSDGASADIPWTQRVDGLVQSLSLLGFAAVVAGLGLMLRVYGEVTVLRQGGHLTPWSVGELIELEPDDDSTRH
jgi:hypothetical protein